MRCCATMLGITGLLLLAGCGGSSDLVNATANLTNASAGDGSTTTGGVSLVLGTSATNENPGGGSTSGNGSASAGSTGGSSATNPAGQPQDPNAPSNLSGNDPNSTDPNNAGTSDGDPNSGDPNSGDPNASDPNPGDPNAGGDPNAPPPYISTSIKIGYYLSGAQAYYTYEPANASSAPVVVFLHAYNTLDPSSYSGWIDHLLNTGNIVIFPVYQDYTTLDWQYTPNAITAIQNALATLAQPNHVAPVQSRFAIFTHSIGGVIGMNICAQAAGAGLPVPKVLLMAAPGDADDVVNLPSIQMSDYSSIPASLRFMAIVGQSDTVVGTATGIELYGKVPQIPSSNKMVLEFMNDSHGLPPIIAQHGSALGTSGGTPITVPGFVPSQTPGGPVTATLDTLDYLGYWSIGDQMLAAAFNGAGFALPPGGAANTVFMGRWSDNVPIAPAQILMP